MRAVLKKGSSEGGNASYLALAMTLAVVFAVASDFTRDMEAV